MLTDALSGARIYVRPGATDMRKQINGLSVIVEQQLECDPFSHAVFLFCNRERRILKTIYWDRSGFALWMKSLETERFPWPATGQQAVREIDEAKLSMLLSGIDFWQAHKRLHYQRVS